MIALRGFVIPALVALTWIGFVAPTILRAFRVLMAYGWWRMDRRNRHLSKRQYVWSFGVFSMGIGVFFLTALRDYLPWELAGERHSHLEASVLIRLIISLAIGWLVTSLTVPQQRISDTRPR